MIFSYPASYQPGIVNSRQSRISFGESQINIIATSDNHGKFEPIPAFYSNIVNHINKIFPKKDDKSTLNIGIFNGDWFMNSSRGGYITDKTKLSGDYQLKFLNKLVTCIKEIVPNFKVLYVPGNHCFDGGDKTLINYLKKADVTTILTNSDFGKSPVLNLLTSKERKKIKQYTILEVPDDKNPKIFNKALVLGVTASGVDYYNPKIMNNIHILDRSNKKDSNMSEKDLKETYSALKILIDEFKKDNPDGVVILLGHTGKRVSEMLAKNVSNIDIIFNGHDHLDEDYFYKLPNGKETHIIALGSDSKKFDSIKLHFNDDGKFDNFYMKPVKFYTKDAAKLKDNPFEILLRKFFKRDLEPLLYISAPEGIADLSHNNIGKENNLLANFVTDSILASIKKYEPNTQVFGVSSAALRQDLKVNDWNTNLSLINLFNGQNDNLSKIYVGQVKGKDIANMLLENISEHMKNMNRNAIVQWSGLQINKSELIKLIESDSVKNINDVKPFIKIRSEEGNYVPIDLEKDYQMAIPSHFFLRPKMPTVMKLEDHFRPLREKFSTNKNDTLTMDQLFRRYIESNKYQVAVPDPDDVRIIV